MLWLPRSTFRHINYEFEGFFLFKTGRMVHMRIPLKTSVSRERWHKNTVVCMTEFERMAVLLYSCVCVSSLELWTVGCPRPEGLHSEERSISFYALHAKLSFPHCLRSEGMFSVNKDKRRSSEDQCSAQTEGPRSMTTQYLITCCKVAVCTVKRARSITVDLWCIVNTMITLALKDVHTALFKSCIYLSRQTVILWNIIKGSLDAKFTFQVVWT